MAALATIKKNNTYYDQNCVCCRTQLSSLSGTTQKRPNKKGRITLKTGRSALFFNRIVQKSIKMGGYLINFPFLLKKNGEKVWCYKKMQYLCNKFLEKLNDRLIVNLFSLYFLRKRGKKKKCRVCENPALFVFINFQADYYVFKFRKLNIYIAQIPSSMILFDFQNF